MTSIASLLEAVVEKECSDLHYIAGEPPRVRQYGDLYPLADQPLAQDTAREELLAVVPEHAREVLEQHNSVDFGYSVQGLGRFRVNVFRHLGGFGGVFRHIPETLTQLSELGMPPAVASFCQHRQGMVLVTGKTGSGKSTTLAAMIDLINQRQRGHIITIEDPIEFIHPRRRSLVSQREIGTHVPDFSSALRSALREDPDVILIGELRDLETISLAVTAAEMGILVFGTLHTSSAVTTIDRLVNAFPFGQQEQVRSMLSTSLRAVIAQQLVKRAGGKGRVAALEILVNTPAVANILREGKTEQLEQTMRSGALVGMINMDSHLRKLMEARLINPHDAYAAAFSKQEFEKLVGGRPPVGATSSARPRE